MSDDIAKLMAMIPLQDVDNRLVKNGDGDPLQTVIKG